ncbi:MAG: type VI secretion system tip protein VgrG [Candidatus Angelobacter sp. Gp1-AA117]|nr:MAG: type VI secretion system tip protein VgrG [Candidatus Angelobacter sp. Gp1-AA117]
MAATAISQDLRLLELKTPLGKNAVVINGLSGAEAISRPFQLKLELLADATTGPPKIKDLLGKAVSVNMLHDQGKRHFHGIVSRISSLPRDGRFYHYRAEVVPWLWLLTLKSESRIFQDKSIVDIIKAVFDELKKSFPDVSYRDATTAEHVPLDYCVQYRETDFNFVSRLMEEEGIFYFFEHTADKHTLVFADSNAAITPCPGGHQILYYEGGFGDREGIISNWQEGLELRSGKYTYRDHNFQLPGKTLEVSEQTHDTGATPLEFYDYPGEYSQRFKNPDQRLGHVQKEGEKLVKLRLDEEVLPGHVFTASSSRRNLLSGHKFSLTKHFNADGEYIIASMNYSATQNPDYISGQPVEGTLYQNTLTCTPAKNHIRPRRTTPKPVIAGPQTATVSVKSGEESWLDKFGRVRVQFHWERKGKNNETSACWIRVAQPWAGASWGAHFWPRVGQEVVVEFLEGDPDRPIITGSVYNAANMPPYKLPDNYTRSGIISRSSKQGGSKNFNELRFEDKKGHEQIFLNAEHDMDHRVEHDHREWVGNNQHLVVKASQHQLIEGNKHEHIKAEHIEKIGGKASREVAGDHKEKIGGKLSLKVGGAQHQTIGSVYTLQAGDEVHLKSGSKIIIEGGMQVSIKGPGGFVDIGPSGVTIQGMMVKINSGGSAGSGTAASPDSPSSPKDPEVADDGSKGGKLK